MNDKKITQTIFTVDNQKTTVDGFYKKAFIKNCQYYIYIFLISLCFSFKPVDTVSQENFNPCSTSNIALKHGEEITHEVFYNWNFVWMGAGESKAVLKEKNGKLEASVTGKTYNSYDWFYKVRDYYSTTLDKNTLLPTAALRDVQEGKYTLYDKVDFDQNKGVIKSLRGKKKENAKEREFNVDDCMHDLVSMIYYFRNINFKNNGKGKEYPMKLFVDRKIWNLKLKYEGQENVKLKGKGKYKALKLTTRMTEGELFDENSKITLWVTDDKNKVPVLVNLDLTIGSIKVVLKDYKGLRHPVTSKIE
jgi:hypothetical protein